MKKTLIFVGSAAVLWSAAAVAIGAGSAISSGGLGQLAGDPTTFGVAVCNHGATALTQPVSVLVTANGTSKTVASAAPIAKGQCAYTYLPYSGLGMSAGNSYFVSVSVNGGPAADYSVAVPGTKMAAAETQPAPTNFLANIFGIFRSFFSRLGTILSGK